MSTHRIPAPNARIALLALGAALVAGCTVRQTRRPGSDMVIVKRSFDPVEVIARTNCRKTPAGPVVGDSLVSRQSCRVLVGDSLARGPVEPILPPQRVP